MLSSNVLVLNRSFMPVHVTNLRRALCLLYTGMAKVVDRQYELFDFQSWSELSVRVDEQGVGLIDKVIRVPRVILLYYYERIPHRAVRFSRLNVYVRDQNTCQYCGRTLPRHSLNLDHVIPVSMGGKTEWENVVCSCIPCNLQKGGRLPKDAGMTLHKKPTKPHWSLFFRFLSRPVFYEEWKPFLNIVDFTYWNLELKD